MCCPLVFEFSVGIGGFVIGLGQISFFFSTIGTQASPKRDGTRCPEMLNLCYIYNEDLNISILTESLASFPIY